MNSKFKGINYLYIFLVATVSFFWFIIKQKTAYDWPAIDMMPMFERYFNESHLTNDFFTNAISNEPNPRWVFGFFVIGLAKILSVDWYVISYSMKLFFVLLIPIFYYLVVFFTLKKYIDLEKVINSQVLILIAVAIVIYPRIAGLFSIAWWSPFAIQAMPQTLALFFGLSAIILKDIGFKYSSVISILLFSVSSFIHPAIGLFLIVLYVILNIINIKSDYKFHAMSFIFGFVAIAILIKIFFSPQNPLSAIEFINIYCLENHSSHYHLEHFGTLSPFSWKISFVLMISLMILPMIYFYKNHKKELLLLSILFVSSYLMAVFLQYLFIDIVPNKIVASIGVVRYTQFGYWMIVILWIAMLSNITFLSKFNYELKYKKLYLIFLVFLFIYGIAKIDSPKNEIYNKNIELYKFLETTPKDSVFGVYFGELKLDIPNIANRAVFIGNGFPFNEDYFIEYNDRNILMYGSRIDRDKLSGKWEGEKVANFFRNLTPLDFLKISQQYRLDYVVIESEFSSKFAKYNPIFQNEKLQIYKVEDFKETN